MAKGEVRESVATTQPLLGARITTRDEALALGPEQSHRIIAVLEEAAEKLGFLGSIMPDVLQHRDELSKFVGDEISRIIQVGEVEVSMGTSCVMRRPDTLDAPFRTRQYPAGVQYATAATVSIVPSNRLGLPTVGFPTAVKIRSTALFSEPHICCCCCCCCCCCFVCVLSIKCDDRSNVS